MVITIKGTNGNNVTAHPSEFYKIGIDPWLLWQDKIVIF